jgi:hypothetical protein
MTKPDMLNGALSTNLNGVAHAERNAKREAVGADDKAAVIAPVASPMK